MRDHHKVGDAGLSDQSRQRLLSTWIDQGAIRIEFDPCKWRLTDRSHELFLLSALDPLQSAHDIDKAGSLEFRATLEIDSARDQYLLQFLRPTLEFALDGQESCGGSGDVRSRQA